MSKHLVFMVVVGSLAGGSVAQTRQGDLVLGCHAGRPGVFSVDWSSGAIRTIRSGVPVDSLRTAHANDGLLVSRPHPARTDVLRLTTTGNLTTLAALPGATRIRGWALDQDGTYAIAGSDNHLYRMPRAGGSPTPFAVVPGIGGRTVTAMCRDGDRGYFMVAAAGPNQLFRVDRVTGALTTFTPPFAGAAPRGIDYVPSTENIVVSTAAATLLVRSDGLVSATIAVAGAAVTVDQRRNRIFVCDASGGVHELDPAGRVVRSRSFPGFQWSSIEIHADQNVSLSGDASPGSTMSVTLSFPESPHRPFCAALAGEDEPGLVLGEGYLNLQFDFVFVLTSCRTVPGFTSGFAGTTDANGRASATVIFGPGFPPGVRLFAGAVAFNPAVPGGFDVSNVEMILTR